MMRGNDNGNDSDNDNSDDENNDFFFLSGFSFTDTDNSQGSRGKERIIFYSTLPLLPAH